MRNGKGKEYNHNGELEFEGEYLNDKKNGKGKEYNNDGKLIFEGEYLNNEKNGKGKIKHHGKAKDLFLHRYEKFLRLLRMRREGFKSF